jgi:hypothetical protein
MISPARTQRLRNDAAVLVDAAQVKARSENESPKKIIFSLHFSRRREFSRRGESRENPLTNVARLPIIQVHSPRDRQQPPVQMHRHPGAGRF